MPPTSTPQTTPWWARALTGAFVGVLAAVLIGLLSLFLGMVAGTLRIWPGALAASIRVGIAGLVVMPVFTAVWAVLRKRAPEPTSPEQSPEA